MKHLTVILLLSAGIFAAMASFSQPVAFNEVMMVENTQNTAEGFIFSTQPRPKKPDGKPSTIITGVFIGKPQQQSEPGDANAQGSGAEDQRPNRSQQAEYAQGPTLAWLADDKKVFHDPFLECGTFTERIWITDISELNGCAPCNNCFVAKSLAPEFIRKESGGLDLADADSLMGRTGFIEWMSGRLPVQNPVFVSDKLLTVQPSTQMSEQGMKNLAREVAMAYRRHTWRVIEVQVVSTGNPQEVAKSF